ncbi:GNAT family N-acetyltransferase [Pseudomonas atagonensis]|uniref:GNAT family N-acetyltransferase n=1 Tax=Pseudomonas atagonensis TaxID=2609964 RepID=UPI0014075D26|nr:GNAT family N-acetyltransferase [Pseudomonas atagonensis]
MEHLIIRNYRNTDAPALSQLFRDVYADHYVQPHVYLPNLIKQNHADRYWHSLVAVSGERLLGHAALLREQDSTCAELALSVVHPDSRGMNIATRLGQQLLIHAQALGCRAVTIKQVTQHPYTQRMACHLGFHNTGLLPDYVPSPFGSATPESVVLGYREIDEYRRPLPDLAWPDSCADLMRHLCGVFGTQTRTARWQGAPIQLEHHANRYDMLLKNLNGGLLEQLRHLPDQWLISIRLQLSRHFADDHLRLTAIGFVFTGLAPAEGTNEGWLALFHRGLRKCALTLHCPHAQHLHEDIQRQIA